MNEYAHPPAPPSPPLPDLERLAVGPFDAVEVLWSEDQTPPAPLDRAAVDYLEARWQTYLAAAQAAGHTLFNGPITFLKSWHVSDGTLSLHLGPTDYKTFLVSVVRDRAWFEFYAPQAMRPGLGNTVLLTSPHPYRQALLGIRSAHVAAYPARAHLFGGVLDYLAPADRNQTGLLAVAYKELREELGLAPHEITRTRPLGLYRDEFLAQPELVWHMETTVPWPTLHARLDRTEHDAVRIVSADSPPDPPLPWTPVAQAAWQDWCRTLST